MWATRIVRLFDTMGRRIHSSNMKLYIAYLRKKGVTIGEGTIGLGLKGIDLTRPVLVEIGKNCIVSQNVTILTHDVFAILREKYGEILCSPGKVVVGDNCFIGVNAIILRGVRIGRNTIIAPGSVVTHDIPPDSVAAGIPCKVVMSLDEYFEKRKGKYVEEAKAYAFEIYRKTGKVPKKEDFWEEFPLFLSRDPAEWGDLPVKSQLGSALPGFLSSKPLYKTFEEFLIDAGVPRDKVLAEFPSARTNLDSTGRLVDWFLNSPIYDGKAYRAYYSTAEKGPVYPEITAYAISLSCMLYKRTRKETFLDRAERCAEYLRTISRNGGIPSLEDNRLYTFDTGIYISSMFDLYDVTRKEIWLKEAKKSLDWLYSLWDDKRFAAVDEAPEDKQWYHCPSVHIVKLVIPLMKAWKYIGETKHRTAALDLLDHYSQLQTIDGSFQVCEGLNMIMTHPHCYATEGFLYAYHAFEKQEFLEKAKESGNWLGKMQNPDGSFYRIYPIGEKAEFRPEDEALRTSDATAQVTRIWKLLGINQRGIEKAYRYLNGELDDGGLPLFKKKGMKSRLFAGRRAVYSWPTFFYLHSLMLPFRQIEYCEELF